MDLGRNYDFITSNVTPLSRFQDDKETYRREINEDCREKFRKKNIIPRNFKTRVNFRSKITKFFIQIFEFRYFNWEVTKWTQSGNMVSFFILKGHRSARNFSLT